MPIHCVPVVAAAIGYAGAQDCEYDDVAKTSFSQDMGNVNHSNNKNNIDENSMNDIDNKHNNSDNTDNNQQQEQEKEQQHINSPATNSNGQSNDTSREKLDPPTSPQSTTERGEDRRKQKNHQQQKQQQQQQEQQQQKDGTFMLTDDTGRSETVRSMYSERFSINQYQNLEVRLGSVNSLRDEEGRHFDTSGGFVKGDFSSGKIRDIKLRTGCWVMSYSTRADILAVGLKNHLNFLETRNYSRIYSLPWSDKVSAIQWCRGDALNPRIRKEYLEQLAITTTNTTTSDGYLVAVAGLDGHVAVYQLDVSLLELEGVHLIHEFYVHAQVRSMSMKPIGDGTVVLAVGDKRGRITLSTLSHDQHGLPPSTNNSLTTIPMDSILGIDMHPGRGVLAVCCKSGKVIVYQFIMSYKSGKPHAVCGPQLWRTQRNGPVRAIKISQQGNRLAFGGYDKTLVLVDTDLYAIVRELTVQGTVNTIEADALERFLAVGCRDKSITFYDTTTYRPVKRFQTPGWVTSISWGIPTPWSDIVAVRSENKGISLLDLTPISMTNISLSSQEGFGTSVSWTPSGDHLARISGDEIQISDSRNGFAASAKFELPGSSLKSIEFCPVTSPFDDDDEKGEVCTMAAVGLAGHLYILHFTPPSSLQLIKAIFVQENLWVVKWSSDGKLLAAGGKGKTLTVFSSREYSMEHSEQMDGRVWDIGFVKFSSKVEYDESDKNCAIAIASGDYKTIFFDNETFQPTLQVIRSRTVRCLDYHPNLPLLAVGDGAGIVAIVNYREEETIVEFHAGGRVNVLQFSPAGDKILVGTDDCMFTIHETVTFKVVQEFRTESFALVAAFSPTGKYLVLGSSNGPYSVVRLGPFLGVELVPLNTGASNLPLWALNETLFRSGFGPSLVQRHMIHGSQDSLQWVAQTLKDHSHAIYTVDRSHGEGCFDTALRLQKMKLLQLAVTTLVNGSLESQAEGRQSILTTKIPEIGRKTLETMIRHHSPELIVEIMKEMTFVKVPFTRPHVVSRDKNMTCASSTYLDPWQHNSLIDSDTDEHRQLNRIAAVLPLPGLGTMSFLNDLVSKAPATAFDNESMALVLRVMWQRHLRRYFIIDTLIFMAYFCLWILLVDGSSSTTIENFGISDSEEVMAIIILLLNTLFAAKETVQSNMGTRPGYFPSVWNQVDMWSIVLVYVYTLPTVLQKGRATGSVPLAVVTTLLLTMKLISYLRAFHETGWLVTVLSQNFRDVRGFLVVLLSILVGFSTSFRLLFANNDLNCQVLIDSETEHLFQECDENPFGSLRKSILSTFEMTILGSYDPAMLYDSEYRTLSILIFVLAVTCVLVVALNALISLLADSYARVQEHATANRRKEKAELIVEYMSLLPHWKRIQIEENTKYFHALLEADADGDLVLDDSDWHGGLNALREDLEENNKYHAESHQKALENLKSEMDQEFNRFRSEVVEMLQDIAEDVKMIQRHQVDGGVTFSGKRVAGAVRAVKEIRRRSSELWTSNPSNTPKK